MVNHVYVDKKSDKESTQCNKCKLREELINVSAGGSKYGFKCEKAQLWVNGSKMKNGILKEELDFFIPNIKKCNSFILEQITKKKNGSRSLTSK